ncbi:hypothetical protein M3231_11085 [Neobacillus mesonae]|nr:hypothetical protein [Neobacillus mesonae]
MDREEFIKNIFSEDLDDESIRDMLMDTCGEYIEKNPDEFIHSAYQSYKQMGKELSYDYAEIKDMDYPELLGVSYEGESYLIKVGIPYILDLWKKPDFLGHTNAYAEALVSLEFEGQAHLIKALDTQTDAAEKDFAGLKVSEIKMVEIKNIEEYFDMSL